MPNVDKMVFLGTCTKHQSAVQKQLKKLRKKADSGDDVSGLISRGEDLEGKLELSDIVDKSNENTMVSYAEGLWGEAEAFVDEASQVTKRRLFG